MGRLVCFTDSEGQCGTCLREDEDCFNCEDAKRMIQGVHSGELSYAAAMRLVYEQEREEKLLLDFVNWVYEELQWQGVLPVWFKSDAWLKGARMSIKKFLNRKKRPAPRVGYKINYGKHPEMYIYPTYDGELRKLEDYVDYAYGFLSPVCGFCEVEPSVEHCTKCDVFLRQI